MSERAEDFLDKSLALEVEFRRVEKSVDIESDDERYVPVRRDPSIFAGRVRAAHRITDARDSPASPSPAGTAPKRIQLSRKKGWRKPPGVIVVSRPSRWGNPFRAVQVSGRWRAAGAGLTVTGYHSKEDAIEDVVRLYKMHVGPLGLIERNAEEFERLRGHDLACWCPLDQPCHADILLEIANR